MESLGYLFNTKCGTYQYLVDTVHSKLFAENLDQITVFWYFHQDISRESLASIDTNFLYKLTEEGWYSNCNAYISETFQNPPPLQTNTGPPPYK